MTDIVWPDSIPLPFYEFGGQPRNSTLVSPQESGKIHRRSRFAKDYARLQVTWVLDTKDLVDAFYDFLATTLYNGTALFKLLLRYPNNNSLNLWAVRLLGTTEAQVTDGAWSISGELELVWDYGEQ